MASFDFVYRWKRETHICPKNDADGECNIEMTPIKQGDEYVKCRDPNLKDGCTAIFSTDAIQMV